MKTENELKRIGKFLSLVLRHKPEEIELTLDKNGWANVSSLLKQLSQYKKGITMEELEWIIDNNDKKRFAFNDNKTMIRASQGHSIDVNLGLKEIKPPLFLYHGTSTDFLDNIKKEGLRKMSRQHVHLSADTETAFNVGKRHGKECVLVIAAEWMYTNKFTFYKSDNDVWLTENVPSQFILFEKTIYE
jgi:putative RNA 2'-phosphotransferase